MLEARTSSNAVHDKNKNACKKNTTGIRKGYVYRAIQYVRFHDRYEYMNQVQRHPSRLNQIINYQSSIKLGFPRITHTVDLSSCKKKNSWPLQAKKNSCCSKRRYGKKKNITRHPHILRTLRELLIAVWGTGILLYVILVQQYNNSHY